MTDFTRVDALKDLLERVRRNAREPRPPFLVATDVAQRLIVVSRTLLDDAPDEPQPESLAFDLVPAPKSQSPEHHRGQNGFHDEATLTGNAEVVETLIVREQAEAARKQIRFEESVNRAPTTRPPPTLIAEPLADEESADLLVLDDLDAAAEGPATEPPGGLPHDLEPASMRLHPLPDLDAIEADLISDGVVDEVSHDRPAPAEHEDETPSSVRKPRELEREEDPEFDGFGPLNPPSEPPPESGEVPSQRRVAGQHEPPPSADNPYGIPGLDASGEVPALDRSGEQKTALADDAGTDDEEDDDDLALSTSVRNWSAEGGEVDAESTKEIRALGRVDVVERTRIAGPPDIIVLKGEPRAVETFGSIFDDALAIGTPSR